MNRRQINHLQHIQEQIDFLEKELIRIDAFISDKETIYFKYQKPLVLYSADDEKFNKRLKTHKNKIDRAYWTFLLQAREILHNQLIYLKIQLAKA